jgi:hypothetical protein
MMVKRTFGSDQTIIRYLLNELSADDLARFEEAYLSDDSLFEQVQALEEELIEDYVKGNLSGRERHHFELHYLASDQRRARIETARQLDEMLSIKAPAHTATYERIEDGRGESWFFSPRSLLRSLAGRRPAPVFGFAAAILALLVTGLAIELLRLRGRLAAVSEERAAVERRAEESERRLVHEREQLSEERKNGAELREKLGNLNSRLGQLEQGRANSQASNDQIVLLALTPAVRGIDKPDIAVISANTSFVELRVELERQEAANLRSYRAVVKTVHESREVWTQEGIKPQRRKSAQYVIVRAPADRFKATGAQDFMLTLEAPAAGGKGYEEIESRYFQVTSKRQ